MKIYWGKKTENIEVYILQNSQFKNEEEINTFLDNQKLMGLVTSKLTLQEMLKDIF